MTEIHLYEGLYGHFEEKPHVVGLLQESESACYDCAMSPMEMPCSPLSDCSTSTTTTECVSQPVSPVPLEDVKKPLKSSLKQRGVVGRKNRRVTWDPNTIFETRPLSAKRRRPEPTAEDQWEDMATMNGTYDPELKAPVPTKRAKLAELDCQAMLASSAMRLPSAFAPQQASSFRYSSPDSMLSQPQNIIPCFNFAACLNRPTSVQQLSSSNNQDEMQGTAATTTTTPLSPPERPSFVPFSFSKPKNVTRSSLLACGTH